MPITNFIKNYSVAIYCKIGKLFVISNGKMDIRIYKKFMKGDP
jgi:hypothetical protein